jgi:hypothetical protein
METLRLNKKQFAAKTYKKIVFRNEFRLRWRLWLAQKNSFGPIFLKHAWPNFFVAKKRQAAP